eukprot:TRINITY_DN50993_c0_g1_i1.p2 TRINITY_DN50993_c0_g1~~TRINITY_DN50993_c0_g1_i1.p2  ORF type:complete len:275 (+),score=69.37 TRINITY_DN50993_c0_g1_i1:82-825(+)
MTVQGHPRQQAGGDDNRHPAVRIAVTVSAFALCIAGLLVDNGYWKWSCDTQCVLKLYAERNCTAAKLDPSTGSPCLDLTDPRLQAHMITSLDYRTGIFRAHLQGSSKGAVAAVGDMVDAGILCDDYKGALAAGQAYGIVALVALLALGVHHVQTLLGCATDSPAGVKLVYFLHFLAGFFLILCTVWVPITFQILEPCEFNYNSLKSEPGASIGIAQYPFAVATLMQLVLSAWSPGIPKLGAVHKGLL